MKLKTIIQFHDLKTGVTREIGEEFEASLSRCDKLVRLGLAERKVEEKKTKPQLEKKG